MCNCNRYDFDASKAEYRYSIEYNGSEFEIVFIECEHDPGDYTKDEENIVRNELRLI
jgi:hypothetical protein